MKIILESTEHFIQVNDVPARLWIGQIEGSGIPIQCLITRMAVSTEHDMRQLETELIECAAPVEAIAFPTRMIL